MSTPRIMQRDLEEAVDLDFHEEVEAWNEYKLEDGTTLKIKLVLQEVKRLKKWKPDGSPIYVIASTNIVRAVGIHEDLKKTPKPSAYEPV